MDVSHRELNIKINDLHHMALRIVYRDEISTFEELLSKDGSITVDNKNLHILAIEKLSMAQVPLSLMIFFPVTPI